MADNKKKYEVIAEKYVGKHRTYKKGAVIFEEEVFGSLDVALNGQKGKKNSRGQSLKDVKATLKLSTAKAKK